MGQWVYNFGKFKFNVDIENSTVLKSYKVTVIKPEAKWSNHEQVEDLLVTVVGGLNSNL